MSQFNTPAPGAPLQTAYQKTVSNCKNLLDAGQYDAAIAMLLEVNAQNPRDVAVLRMLGNAMMMIDRRAEAIRHLSFAVKLDPANPDAHCDLATAYRRIDQMRKAHQSADTALKLAPNSPRAVMVKARLLQAHAGTQQAYELVKSAAQATGDPMLLTIFGQLCRELKRQGEAIDPLRAALNSPTLSRTTRQDILFVLGHLLDSVGEYDDAFDCFKKGNAMSVESSHVDLEATLERWAPEKFASVPQSDLDGSRAVFIVGMPRSGTTLTEQIIAAHPQAGGVGESDRIDLMARGKELDAFDQAYVNRSGRAYLDMLSANYPSTSIRRVCDKMPENFYFLGFISRCLPGSSIIHCKRNPIDTCLSIYFQRFGPRIYYASDLDHCAQQYLSYLKIMDHFQHTLGIEMHEAIYEQTTSDPEPTIRAMLGHVGLGFDPACLEFHKSKKSVHTASVSQIRQPLYTSSSERWHHYEKHIGPLIDRLGHLVDA